MLDLARSNSILTSRASAQAVQIAEGLRFASLQEAITQIGRSSLPGDVTQHFIDLLTERADGSLRSAADQLASEALALGRHDEATVFAADIEEATYTALLDDNTCDACAEADGTVTEFGSAEYERLKPPYQDCEGGGRCRCQFVFTLKTEAPGGPVSITPLRPDRPFLPVPTGPFPPPFGEPVTPSPPPVAVAPTVTRPAAAMPLPPLPETGTAKEFADALQVRALATEPGVTTNIRAVAQETGGDLFGFKFRVKGLELDEAGNVTLRTGSLERKIASDVPALTGAAMDTGVKDALRYTTLYEPEAYTASTVRAMAAMKARGYRLIRETNYWNGGLGYQGMNAVWRAPNGQVFETQFHTPESVKVKEEISHPLYDRLKVATDPVETQDLRRRINEAWAGVEQPPGVLTLPGRLPAGAPPH